MSLDRFLEDLVSAVPEVLPQEVLDALWLAAKLQPKIETANSFEPESALARSHQAAESGNRIDSQTSGDTTANTSGSSPARQPTAELFSQRKFAGDLVLRTPGVTALPNAAAIAGAIRPLKRKIDSRFRCVLDENGTAEHYARERRWLPVLKPAPARMFDLALIVDQAPSMGIWRQTLKEWRGLLERQAFAREIRVWRLDTASADGVRLLSENGQSQRSAREVADPSGRRLVMVVSDCVSPAWWSGRVTELTSLWARSQPVSVVQVLPRHLWAQTALRAALQVQASSERPGRPACELQVAGRHLRRAAATPSRAFLPVTTIEPGSLRTWARLIAGPSGGRGTAISLGSSSALVPAIEMYSTPQQLVRDFRARASPTAFKLACILAAAVLRLPIMRLVQHIMLPNSGPTHLAEFFCGGLLKTRADETESWDPEAILYDFENGVRAALLDAGRVADQLQVVGAISNFIKDRFGQTLDFEAYLRDPESVEATPLSDQAATFASIVVQVLDQMGGAYGQAANRIRDRLNVKQANNELTPQEQTHDKRFRVQFLIPSIFDGREGSVLDMSTKESHVVKDRTSLLLSAGAYAFQFPDIGFSRAFEIGDADKTIAIDWAPTDREVVVYGSSYSLEKNEVWMCRALGRALAQAGVRLTVNGWPGVDELVAKAYADAVLTTERTNDMLYQYIGVSRKPNFPRGRIIRGWNEIDVTVRHAVATVLIGGRGATYKLFQELVVRKHPVLPISDTGGDGARAYAELSQMRAVDLKELGNKISSSQDAEVVACAVVRFVQSLSPARSRVQKLLWVGDRPPTDENIAIVDRIREAGIRLETARSTEQALSLIQSVDFDSIISDMRRSEGSHFNPIAGFELYDRLRATKPGVPVIFFTSKRGVDEVRKRFTSGETISTTTDAKELLMLLGIDNDGFDFSAEEYSKNIQSRETDLQRSVPSFDGALGSRPPKKTTRRRTTKRKKATKKSRRMKK